LATWYQANNTATAIAPGAGTPSDAAVVAAITELHNQHVNVMFKPMVDGADGSWRGTFTPTDVNAWFTSFTAFITHYAQLAQDNNVELLCFGTEYVQLSKANPSNWNSVINAIRAIYKGPLAYAANATYAGDEFTAVVFWDQMDVLGLDAYFPLTDQDDPSVPQLVSAWSMNRNSENIVADVLNFAAAHPSQPVLFSEIGYRSISGANVAPWDWSDPCPNPADLNNPANCPVDDAEQQNAYEAMFEVWSQHSAVMRGHFWWAWPVPPPDIASDTDYNPRNKPAQTIVLQFWQ